MNTENILPQACRSDNISSTEKPVPLFKKSKSFANPFINAGNVTGIALEFFIRQMATRLLPRTAADFLCKVCNVAAASEAYQIYYSKATMAEKAGVCVKSVQRYMRAIEASGIMTCTRVSDSIKGHQPNVYTFTPAFISSVRSFFTEKVAPSRLKKLRTMAQSELSKLIDSALAPFIGTMRKILNQKDIKPFPVATPIGQFDPTPTGQIDPQEVVLPQEVGDQNLPRDGEVVVEALQEKTISGSERKAMTNAALIATRKKRDIEQAQQVRAKATRYKKYQFLAKRDAAVQRTARQDQQTSHNATRLEQENQRHNEVLAQAARCAQRDPTVIKSHLNNLRAMLGKKPKEA